MMSPDPTLSQGDTPGDPEMPGGARRMGMRLAPPSRFFQTWGLNTRLTWFSFHTA